MKITKPFTIWMTGLPSSGKTTLANAVTKIFKKNNIPTIHIDGDEFRKGVSADLGYSEADRDENNRRAIYLSKLLNDQGFVVISSFISPKFNNRDQARQIIENCVITYINTDLQTCIERDVKNLYKKAKRGLVSHMTGIAAGYDIPINPDIDVSTKDLSLEQSLHTIIDGLLFMKLLED